MKVVPADIPDVLILEPKVFGDERGFFFESYNRRAFQQATGINVEFVQDNHSRSARNVLRGIHYQLSQPQGKLIRVVAGEIFDVGVDLRRGSATFGRWTGIRLAAESHRMLWIPPRFGHGFLVVSKSAEVLYKATDYYAPNDERSLLWNDPEVGIDWPLRGKPLLSKKDRRGARLRDAQVYP